MTKKFSSPGSLDSGVAGHHTDHSKLSPANKVRVYSRDGSKIITLPINKAKYPDSDKEEEEEVFGRYETKYVTGDNIDFEYGGLSAPENFDEKVMDDGKKKSKKKKKKKKKKKTEESSDQNIHIHGDGNGITVDNFKLTSHEALADMAQAAADAMRNNQLNVSTTSSSSKKKKKSTKDKIWDTSTEEERARLKQFWISLSEEHRRELIKIEKQTVTEKMWEQQKHSCNCPVCSGKRAAIEEELQFLYDTYYAELDQYAVDSSFTDSILDNTKLPLTPMKSSESKNISLTTEFYTEYEDEGGEEEKEKYDNCPLVKRKQESQHLISHNRPAFDHNHSHHHHRHEDSHHEGSQTSSSNGVGKKPNSLDLFDFGNNLSLNGGLLTVADDLLKNDGKKFIDMMEQLAERRIARDEEALLHEKVKYDRSTDYSKEEEEEEYEDEDGDEYEEGETPEEYNMEIYDEYEQNGASRLAQSDENEDYDEEYDEYEEDYDDEYDDEEDSITTEQRIAEGRRMLQIIAARMFEQRVLAAYRESVAEERQQKLLEELEEEERAKNEREQKKLKDKERKKDKKRAQRQAKEEEKARKEAERREAEAAAKAEQERKNEENRLRQLELKAKKEAEERKKREELEKRRKLEEKKREEKKRKEREEQEARRAQKLQEEEKKRLAEQAKAEQLKSEQMKQERIQIKKRPEQKVQVNAEPKLHVNPTPKPDIHSHQNLNGRIHEHELQRSIITSPPPSDLLSPVMTIPNHLTNTHIPAPAHSHHQPILNPQIPEANGFIPQGSMSQPLSQAPIGRTVPLVPFASSQTSPGSFAPNQTSPGPFTSMPVTQTPTYSSGRSAFDMDDNPIDELNRLMSGSFIADDDDDVPIGNVQARSPIVPGYQQGVNSFSSLPSIFASPSVNNTVTMAASSGQSSGVASGASMWSNTPALSSLWNQATSSKYSAAHIKRAAIQSFGSLASEGWTTPDGFVSSMLLYQMTIKLLKADSSLSLTEFQRACGVLDANPDSFECLRDHVGMITHMKYRQILPTQPGKESQWPIGVSGVSSMM